ncbi:hypothetical protein FOLKNPGA_02845 [Legionella sp. PC1000]|uniref:Uncharacterized protein n=1 Tax=Legionella resiliens TaxID=2905958 RepID=A0A977P0I0_9GAMM|nr:hypothetical protein [Legionella sp. PC1000]QLZ70041.1 hypothetical protein FOLKNPGA_02845 [Legionella sp. PC1000]UWX38854.1 hypothetical protein LXO92_p00020 [Legionella sp. 8cVS16]
MCKLFQEKKRNAQRVIDGFTDAKTKVDTFCNTLNMLQDKLYAANTKEEFDGVVQLTINEEKNVHRFLLELTNGTDEETISKVKAYMVDLPNFKNAMTLLNYTEIATKNIIDKKERLSLQEALSNLTIKQQTELLVFINKLKELKPIAELLINQQKLFKERLHEAPSLDVVDEIEDEVQNRNRLLKGALERLLPYPEDDMVSGEIIKILKRNRHFLTILESFDFHESLMEEILNARATIIAMNESFSLGC